MKTIKSPDVPKDVFTSQRKSNWSADLVEKRFEEAFITLKRLPPVMTQGYYNLWPDIRYSKIELLMQKAGPISLQALPEDISKLEETMQWIIWVDIPERKLIWKRAAGVPWKVICWETNRGRTSLWNQHKMALTQIAQRLEGLGIAPR